MGAIVGVILRERGWSADAGCGDREEVTEIHGESRLRKLSGGSRDRKARRGVAMGPGSHR